MIKVNKFFPEKQFFDMSIEELRVFVKEQNKKFNRYQKRRKKKYTRKRKINRKKITRKNIV
tara:strand:+ start:2743 stop:2925 length:183 start_codon:yes stop_codon:yes gene_type:complete